MRRWIVGAVAVAAAALGVVAATSAESPDDAVRFPAGFSTPIYVGDTEVWSGAPAPTTTTTEAPATSSTAAPTTSTTQEPTTTSTVPPSTAATSTVPATTAAPSTTAITSSTTSSTTVAPSTTRPATTTSVPAGVAFSEDFADPAAFTARFDHGVSGGVGKSNDWPADHDMMCGNPNSTHRTIHMSSTNDQDAPFYHCTPGDDPGKAHLMTSINTDGYTIAWFSPKQTFANVSKVCWDQNMNDVGGGKWTQVVFPTTAEYSGRASLGFTSPEFPNDGGPSTPEGSVSHGVKLFDGTVASWSQLGEWNQFASNSVQRVYAWGDTKFSQTTTDHAPRYRQCLVDNGNGTLTFTRVEPDGSTQSRSVQGEIPNGPVRVVFEDDNYNPDKHFNADGIPTNSGEYTWHWDNIQITTS